MKNARLGWRWAFLIQMPLFFVSLGLTQYNLHYVTPVSYFPFQIYHILISSQGKSKSAKDVLKRIDYGGSFSLFMAVGLVHWEFVGVITSLYVRRSVHSSYS